MLYILRIKTGSKVIRTAIKYLPSWHCQTELALETTALLQQRLSRHVYQKHWWLNFLFDPACLFISVLKQKNWTKVWRNVLQLWLFPPEPDPSYSRECEQQHDEWHTRCVTNHPLLLSWTLSSFKLLGPALVALVCLWLL